MSIHQTDHLLRGGPLGAALPPPTGPSYFIHFVYDHHYDLQEFAAKFNSARLIGFGGLKGFRFHINVLGKANLRKAYFTGKVDPIAHYLMPFPSTKIDEANSKNLWVLGYLVKVDRHDDVKIHQYYGSERIRAYQTIEARIVDSRLPIARVKAAFYFDPRNTIDGLVNLKETNRMEYDRWTKGLTRLIQLKCPRWYIEKILKHLNGFAVDFEPLQIALKHIEHQPDPNPKYPERSGNTQTVLNVKEPQKGGTAILQHRKNQVSHSGQSMLGTGQAKRASVSALSNPIETLILKAIQRPGPKVQQLAPIRQRKRQFSEVDPEPELSVKKPRLQYAGEGHPKQTRPYPPSASSSRSTNLLQRRNSMLTCSNGVIASSAVVPGMQYQRKLPSMAIFAPPVSSQQQAARPQQSQNHIPLLSSERSSFSNDTPSNPQHQRQPSDSRRVLEDKNWIIPSRRYEQAMSQFQSPTGSAPLNSNGNKWFPPNQNAQQPGPSHQRRRSGSEMYAPNAAQETMKMKLQQSGNTPVVRSEEGSRATAGGMIQQPVQKHGPGNCSGTESQVQSSSTVRRLVPPPSGLRNEL